MNYLLDTNVVSELRRPKPHGAVLGWVSSLRDEQIFVSAVTCGEIQAGIEITRRQDRIKAAEIDAWLDGLVASSQVLPMDERCFRQWARLMTDRSATLTEDAMIAATASVHGLTIATRNTSDFKSLGVETFDPWGYR